VGPAAQSVRRVQRDGSRHHRQPRSGCRGRPGRAPLLPRQSRHHGAEFARRRRARVALGAGGHHTTGARHLQADVGSDRSAGRDRSAWRPDCGGGKLAERRDGRRGRGERTDLRRRRALLVARRRPRAKRQRRPGGAALSAPPWPTSPGPPRPPNRRLCRRRQRSALSPGGGCSQRQPRAERARGRRFAPPLLVQRRRGHKPSRTRP